jgi:hypothetical protein
MKNWYWYIIGIIVIIVLTKQCEGEPRTITKTKIEYINVTDTITNTIIQEVPKKVYVERVKNIKGNDSIIYKDKPNDSTITANQYDTKLESNKATADLKITTTGELLNVTGVINYTKEVKTIETTKIRDASGFYIYANMPVNSIQPEVGALYQFKNKMFISAGAQYNSFTKSADIKVGLGVKIF